VAIDGARTLLHAVLAMLLAMLDLHGRFETNTSYTHAAAVSQARVWFNISSFVDIKAADKL